MTTTNTITDEQIATLQDEAAAAGDHEQVRLCEIALIGYGFESLNAAEKRSFSAAEQREARERCAEAIADAEAARG